MGSSKLYAAGVCFTETRASLSLKLGFNKSEKSEKRLSLKVRKIYPHGFLKAIWCAEVAKCPQNNEKCWMLTVTITLKSPKKALSVECWLSVFIKKSMNVECWMFPTFTTGYFFQTNVECECWFSTFTVKSTFTQPIMKISGHILLKLT